MGEKKSADAPGESQRNDFSDAGSNPAISTKNPGQPFGAGLDFLYCGIRTREGFGVKKMCQRHIFSRKREGGTAREAWGVPSEQYAAAPQTVKSRLSHQRDRIHILCVLSLSIHGT